MKSNWWQRLDPKKRRMVLVVGIGVVLAVLYLAFRKGGSGEESPEEQAENERLATERGNLENTYPSAYQFGYPGGPGMEGGGGGGGVMEPEVFEGPEGIPGGEGPTGESGPPGEPGPPGAPGPTKNAAKRAAGGNTTGGGHGGSVKGKDGKKHPGSGKNQPTHAGNPIGGKKKIAIGQSRPVSIAPPASARPPQNNAQHPAAVNTGNRCVNGGVGGHTPPAGYHLFCQGGYIWRAPN